MQITYRVARVVHKCIRVLKKVLVCVFLLPPVDLVCVFLLPLVSLDTGPYHTCTHRHVHFLTEHICEYITNHSQTDLTDLTDLTIPLKVRVPLSGLQNGIVDALLGDARRVPTQGPHRCYQVSYEKAENAGNVCEWLSNMYHDFTTAKKDDYT